MQLIILRVLYAFVCAGAIATLVNNQLPYPLSEHPFTVFVVLLLVTQSVTVLDILLPRKRLEIISAIYFGLLIGVMLGYFLLVALRPAIDDRFEPLVTALTLTMLPYMCIAFLLQTKDDFRFIIPYVEFAKELKGGRSLVIDSSALIDGRIAEVLETKILEAEVLVPQFVLNEIQDIADSSDKTRRTRGRRGLDVLYRIQNNPSIDVKVYDGAEDREAKTQTVDQRIILLAKRLNGRVVTSDFNLNKVAGVQGVDVINLNDVANALKPRFLPGESVRLKIIREGESPGQGVGYLDDGTMVVCEQAASHVGHDLEIIVTSVLQNSAGRMIFGRTAQSVGHATR